MVMSISGCVKVKSFDSIDAQHEAAIPHAIVFGRKHVFHNGNNRGVIHDTSGDL